MVKRKLKNTKSDLVLAYNSLLIAKGFVLGFLFSITACQTTAPVLPANAASDAKPDWVITLPQSSGIIYATGSSTIYVDENSAIKSATESARVELAKSIRVTVSAETTVNQHSDNGKMSFHFDETIKNTTPEMVLSGLKIVDNYLDSHASTAYVLVSFNKKEAIIEIRQLLATNDDELAQTSINLTDTAGQQLTQAIYVKKLLLKRKQYNEQLINLKQAKVKLTDYGQTLLMQANQVFNSIAFAVSSGKDIDLQDKIIEAITNQGLKVNNSTADFHLTYRIKWRDIARDNLFYSIATATVSLNKNKTVLRTFKQKAKGTSSDKGLARDKAIEKIGEQFTAVLAKELLASFENTVPK